MNGLLGLGPALVCTERGPFFVHGEGGRGGRGGREGREGGREGREGGREGGEGGDGGRERDSPPELRAMCVIQSADSACTCTCVPQMHV